MTELEKKNAMIEWLAKKAWKPTRIIEEEHIPAHMRCYDKKCDFECWKCWVKAAERAVEKDMDLTENERKWLLEREKDELYFCRHCDRKSIHCRIRGYCPTNNSNFRDAAEFEARVTAKLASMMYQLAANSLSRDFSCEKSCVAHLVCQKDKSCVHSFMKYARIAVEEEMDVDR